MSNTHRGVIKATFVCLANSRKKLGRCVAGKAYFGDSFSKWVRPISAHETEALFGNNTLCSDGQEIGLLDIVEAHFIEAKPTMHQQENYLIDPALTFLKVSKLSKSKLSSLVDQPMTLWGAGSSSTSGLNDYVAYEEIENYRQSLYFLHFNQIKIYVSPKFGQTGPSATRDFRAEFRHQGSDYRLKITDPVFEELFSVKAFGIYLISDVFLTISLGERWHDKHWKLVAAVILNQPEREWEVI